MSGIINIEEHNDKVKVLDAKKAAIKEASELGINTLENNKPKPVKTISCGNSTIEPIVYEDKRYSNGSTLTISSITYTCEGRYSREAVSISKESLVNLAACIIKAFGPIPQELIDSVEVK